MSNAPYSSPCYESYIVLIEFAELISYSRVVQVAEGILQFMPNRVAVIRGAGPAFPSV